MIDGLFIFLNLFFFFLILLFVIRVWKCVRLVNEVCERWLEIHVTKNNGDPNGSGYGS